MLPLLLAAAVGQPDPNLEQALRLLRPHLTYQAPAAPPVVEGLRAVQDRERRGDDDTPWQEALGAPRAYEGDVPKALVEAVARQAKDHPSRPETPPLSAYPWLLKDPGHADVKKAVELLRASDGDAARRWLAEIRRNNTVLTLDVAGAFAAGKTARVVLDARSTDRVTLRLYRLTTAEDVLRVHDRIGTDFLYRAYAFERAIERRKHLERDLFKLAKEESSPPPLPEALQGKPLATWNLALDRLKRIDPDELRHRDDLDLFDSDDGGYDDTCFRHRHRVDRSYLPAENAFSSWRAGLIVEVPGEHLKQPGAYLLRVEANGQFALAPILVDPPALTLRRCPDGVLAVVVGDTPLAKATVHARKHADPATTDAEGVAFLRVVARGDRAIVAEHDGRFAVGGFGTVFAGIYHDPELQRPRRARAARGESKLREDAVAYADGTVVAVWTDRPVYRPGEEVRAKLVVRKRVAKAGAVGFRADEYDAPTLELPGVGTEVDWALIDADHNLSKERTWKLNEFGSASGTFRLPADAPRGEYRLQVTVADRRRVLPAVFVVDEFTHPAADLRVDGLPAFPEKLPPGRKLDLTLSVRHPVGPGTVTLTLANETTRWNLTPDAIDLDKAGQAKATVALPLHLPAERMALIATLTDAAGQKTSRAFPVAVEAGSTPLLGRLPKFVPADQAVEWRTAADEIELEQGRDEDGTPTFQRTRVKVVGGVARFAFPAPGWYAVRAGQEEQEVFAFGGTQPPWETYTRRQMQADAGPEGWVDLAHYGGPDGNEGEPRDDRPSLRAMLGPTDGVAGEALPVLVYVPFASARLLLTLEGHSVVDYHTVRVVGKAGRYHVVRLPLRERHRPHFYLQGTILAGTGEDHEALDRLERKQEALERLDDDAGEDPVWCKIRVGGRDKPAGVRVAVTADRAAYEPGDRVTLDVRTTDAAGKPLATEVALSVIDERVFAVAGDRLPAVLAAFAGTRGTEGFVRKTWRHGPGVRPERGERQQKQAELRKELAREMAKGGDRDALVERPGLRPLTEFGELPVSVVPLAPPRVELRETAFWSPEVRTDTDGRASVTFDAPANLTRYRVSALALAKSGDLGDGRATLRVGKPVEVEVFLPPEIAVGATVEVPVQVRNTTDRERRVEVAVTLTGLERAGGEPARPRTVVVPARGVATVTLALVAPKEGPVSVTAKGGDAAFDDAETRRAKVVKPKAVERPPGEVPVPGM